MAGGSTLLDPPFSQAGGRLILGCIAGGMTYPPLPGGRLWLWGRISPLLGRAEQAMGPPLFRGEPKSGGEPPLPRGAL